MRARATLVYSTVDIIILYNVIVDLNGSPNIQVDHVAEIIEYWEFDHSKLVAYLGIIES